jgi:hypothetical protein
MRSVFLSVLLWLVVSAAAAAQSLPRVSVSVNGGAQSGSRAFPDHFEFQQNIETATADVRYSGKPDALVDASVGVRMWKNLGAAVAVSRFTHTGTGTVEASIPHPFLFGRLRSISGSISATRAETSVHAQILYGIALSRRLRLVASGGPTRFNVEQTLVNEVQYDDTFPYDTATFRTATTRKSTASAAGFNAGVDVAWMFTTRIGVGGFARGSRGRVTLDTADNRHIKVDAGGIQGGAGLRLAF